MGQIGNNKYHVTDDGKIFKVDKDGSVSRIGDVSQLEGGKEGAGFNASGYNPDRLRANELLLLKKRGKSLTPVELMEVAEHSINEDALHEAMRLGRIPVKLKLISRYENGDTFLQALLAELTEDKSVTVRTALAKCTRRFTEYEVLENLLKDKNSTVKYCAKKNPNYRPEMDKSGCFSVIALFLLSASVAAIIAIV